MKPADLIKRFEGCRLQAYPDPASPRAKGTGTDGRPWTVGYGCTGPEIHEGTCWTQQQADEALEHRMQAVEHVVDSLVKVPITEAQRAVLCSFAWNEGTHALAGSTLLRLLNAGDTAGAAAEFHKWERAGADAHLLASRREAERELFLGVAA